MDEEDVVNTVEFSHKKAWDPTICDMDDAWGHYAQWDKSDKDKYGMISPICGT